MVGFSDRLLFGYANPHLLLAKLSCWLHQDLPFPAEAGVTVTAFPLGMTAAERYSPVSIWQTSPAPPLPSSPEGAADQEGPRYRETAGLLHCAGLEGGSLRCWDGDEWGVWLLSLGKSREGLWEKRKEAWWDTWVRRGETKWRCLLYQASTATWHLAFIHSELFKFHWPLFTDHPPSPGSWNLHWLLPVPLAHL